MPTPLETYLSQTSKKRTDVIAYLAALEHLRDKAPKIASHITKELQDQRSSLKLIASENYSSLSVQLAMGNLLTDKYCEGYPYHRFYAGCENVDAIEAEAAESAQKLFNVDHAYVQPHSGADANLVAFWAILTEKIQSKRLKELGKKSLDELTPEDFETLRKELSSQRLLGLSLGSGGHLTHGYRHNVSGKMFQSFFYDVDPKTGLLDYDTIAQLARKIKPLILLAGYSAYPRRIDFAKMRAIADEVGAVLFVDMAHFAGLVAGKVFTGNENPVPFADVISSTTHKTLRGPKGGLILSTKAFSEAINKGCPLVLGGPLPHVIAAKAIAFQEALAPDFSQYAHKIVANCRALAEGLKKEGLTLLTGGTDNHLLLINLGALGLTGRVGENTLKQVGITANRNMIPQDPEGPWYTSGMRFGTAAITTRGMGEKEMVEIASIIALVLRNTQADGKAKGVTPPNILDQARSRIQTLLQRFPLYPEIPTII